MHEKNSLPVLFALRRKEKEIMKVKELIEKVKHFDNWEDIELRFWFENKGRKESAEAKSIYFDDLRTSDLNSKHIYLTGEPWYLEDF